MNNIAFMVVNPRDVEPVMWRRPEELDLYSEHQDTQELMKDFTPNLRKANLVGEWHLGIDLYSSIEIPDGYLYVVRLSWSHLSKVSRGVWELHWDWPIVEIQGRRVEIELTDDEIEFLGRI